MPTKLTFVFYEYHFFAPKFVRIVNDPVQLYGNHHDNDRVCHISRDEQVVLSIPLVVPLLPYYRIGTRGVENFLDR